MDRDEVLINEQIPGARGSQWNGMRSMTQQLLEGRRLAREARTSASSVLMHVASLQTSFQIPLGDVLPRNYFLQQLQREKSRTDRSKAPLSIALFNSHCKERGVEGLLEVLRSNKRETDILGYLGEDSVAILLPDTNEQGAQRLAQKVLTRADNLPLSTTTRTYPDQLFENLIADEKNRPDLYAFFPHETTGRREGSYPLKRTLDILGALVGIVLFSPLMLIAALAVAMSSPGPVIFRQIRLGKGGAPFYFYKFRSMYTSADDRIHREYVAALIEGGEEANQGDVSNPLYKLKADPRITRIGRLLRKTSLDELPQFFNVLKGDMSLVGPRPPVPYEVERYQSWHLRRILEARPGITGLWQVEGRSKISFDDMVRLDLRYIRSSSLLLDFKILLKTLKVVLLGDGAR